MASMPELSTLGGYDYDYIDCPPESLTCPICLLPFRDPHMLDCCGAKYCEICIGRVKAAGQPCPLCKQNFNSMLDRVKQRKVLSLRVHCSNKKQWCVWQGELRHLDRHEKDECGWELVECRHQCGKQVPLRHLSQHEEEECPHQSTSKECVENIEKESRGLIEPHVDHSTSLETDDRGAACGTEEEEHFVAGLDNRYVCESATVTQEGKVELTEEQLKVCMMGNMILHSLSCFCL